MTVKKLKEILSEVDDEAVLFAVTDYDMNARGIETVQVFGNQVMIVLEDEEDELNNLELIDAFTK